MKSLSKQQHELSFKSPDGVKIVVSQEDPMDIQADIYGPQATPYEGGVFRIKLIIPSDFPHIPPKGYFVTKIYHPNVSAKGEICVNTLKKDWNPKNWSLYNVFEVIKCLLIYPFAESSLNEEAGKLFMENYQEYYKIAKLHTNIHGNKAIREFGETYKEPSKVILTNDSIISNENNILLQKNTNEGTVEKSLGKKLIKPLPISENDLLRMSEEKNHKSFSDKKECKTNLRTFELLRTNTSSMQSVSSPVQFSNITFNPYSQDSNKGKKDDMNKWISRI